MSKQADLLRFSGPELSDLLDQVVTELGSTAAISAVNRVRTGGVAGFFCKEEFEVIVNLSAGGRSGRSDIAAARSPTAGSAPATPQVPKPTLDVLVPSAIPPAGPGPVGAYAASVQQPQVASLDPVPASEVDPSAPQPSPFGPTADVAAPQAEASESDPAEIFGGPQPVSTSAGDAGFLALLERRLEEESALETAPRGRRNPPSGPEQPSDDPDPISDGEPIVPAPGVAESDGTEGSGDPAGLDVLAEVAGPSSGFWARLQQARQELSQLMPVQTSFVALVGPLSLITPIASRLRSEPRFSSADVVVLTDRTGIVSEPQWRLVRSGNQLVEEAIQRADGGEERPTLLLIDVPTELPNWVAPLQHRLRMAGVGLFRYAIPGQPDAQILDEYRQASDVPYVLDLISRVRPERLVEFLDQHHPITSVSGADVTPELLVALRDQVALQEPDSQREQVDLGR